LQDLASKGQHPAPQKPVKSEAKVKREEDVKPAQIPIIKEEPAGVFFVSCTPQASDIAHLKQVTLLPLRASIWPCLLGSNTIPALDHCALYIFFRAKETCDQYFVVMENGVRNRVRNHEIKSMKNPKSG